MREIVQSIINGEYDFSGNVKPLVFSVEQIVVDVLPGQVTYGSFYVMCEDGETKGYVYSKDLRLKLKEENFEGRQPEILYEMDSTGLSAGEVHSGVLDIVSDHGEYELPYTMRVLGDTPYSSMGEVRNLFHFANLAKSDWDEAQELFYSEQFKKILEGQDPEVRTAYRGYRSVYGNPRNMESFLEITRKKVVPVYTTDVSEVSLEYRGELKDINIKIKREGWGYTCLYVYSTADFAIPEKDVICDADFDGNTTGLHIDIDTELLVRGLNEAEIVIYDRNGRIEVPVRINCPVAHYEDEDRGRLKKLMDRYLAFRTGRLSRADFAGQCEQLLSEVLSKDPDCIEYRLYQVQLMLTQKRLNEAKTICDRIGVLMEERECSIEMRAYHLYLKSLCENNADATEEYAEQIEKWFADDESNWRLAWLMMYMDESYSQSDRKKWKLLKEQYEYGNTSPLLYIEALHLLSQNSRLMEETGDYERAVYTFAMRRDLTDAQLRGRFTLLAGEERSYSDEMFRLLKYSYEQEPEDLILESICKLLIKGNCIGKEYFEWYEKAVKAEIRLPRLYEYYIMSVDPEYTGTLPRLLLMYFAYRSGLDATRNAFLYANVIKHKDDYQELYEQYLPAIEEFTREQLIKRNLNDNLAFLYSELLKKPGTETEFAEAFAELLYVEKLCVTDDCFTSVIVVYEHLKNEQVYPVYNGETYVSLYGNKYSILVETADGDRFGNEEFYTRTKMIKGGMAKPDLLHPILGVFLSCAEEGSENPVITPENEAIFSWLSVQDDLTEDYRLRIRLALLEYYFDNDMVSETDTILSELDPVLMSASDREQCVRIMVASGMYDQAFEWVQKCGIESIDIKIQVRLCDRLLARSDQEYSPEMLKICEGILFSGKYDGDILNYLIRYSRAGIKGLKELWRAAVAFELSAAELLSRMMRQILYTGTYVPEIGDIYQEGVKAGIPHDLDKAYLSMLSYQYLIEQRKLDESIFDRVLYIHRLGEELMPVCKLAYLLVASERFDKGLSEEERNEAAVFLDEMHEADIFLPYFMKFSSMRPYLKLFDGWSYIEYRGDAGSKVVLHYVFEREDGVESEYLSEEMKHIYGGIFVKSFLLFFGEKIRYYITEEDGRQEKLTKSSVLECAGMQGAVESSRYELINNLAIARNMGDEKTFIKLVQEYDRKKHMAESLFGGGE
ncbi:MAG: DUF5717 family protein [Lachnospiraceae bacterium]|nr:DUF5717 family protein [Lachnospiraceae bacterium]